MNKDLDYCKLALAVIETESAAISRLSSRINHNFANACEILLACKGRIVVTGMGKSGHIGKKIAATLASTGSPAFFMHPGEASHGDMGMLTHDDVVVAMSYSGNTHEIVTLLPLIKRLAVPMISMTGNANSEISTAADINLDISVEQEACPLGLAPTASTSCMLAMGDALAIALLQARGFTADDFALSHPGGTLGKRLLLRIDDIMYREPAIPKVYGNTLLSEALIVMTEKKLGVTTIIDPNGKLCGIFTDGDLRRTLDNNHDIHKTKIESVMTSHCKTIKPGILAAEALQIMEKFRISILIVVNDDNHPVGIIHMHDLLKAGVV